MATLLIRCRLHAELSAEQFAAWLNGRQAALVRDSPAIRGLRAAPLEGAAWVLELDIDAADDRDPLSAPVASLVGDLRLLGLNPTVYRSDTDLSLTSTTSDR